MTPDWKPIETGPKKQTVLLAFPDGTVQTGFLGPKFSTFGVNYGDEWGVGIRWYEKFKTSPTHWMPLPEPPGNNPEDSESQEILPPPTE